MAGDVIQVPIRILDKEYTISCSQAEREALLESSRLLNDKMREIRATGKVIGTERIAVMAAINLANELLQQRHQGTSGPGRDISRRLRLLQERIEDVLDAEGRQLKL